MPFPRYFKWLESGKKKWLQIYMGKSFIAARVIRLSNTTSRFLLSLQTFFYKPFLDPQLFSFKQWTQLCVSL